MTTKQKKCLVCAKKSDISLNICPYCNTEKTKTQIELTSQEKKLRRKFTNLRHVGLLLLFGGMLLLVGLIVICLYEMPPAQKIGQGLFVVIWLAFLIITGVSLGAYQRWAYVTSIVFYSLSLIGFIAISLAKGLDGLGMGLAGIIVSLIILWCLLSSSEAVTLFIKTSSKKKGDHTRQEKGASSAYENEKRESNLIIYISIAIAIIIGIFFLYITRPR